MNFHYLHSVTLLVAKLGQKIPISEGYAKPDLNIYLKFYALQDFALGIVVKILFAPFAKRLERKARSNAQIFTGSFIS